jgi:hypothetical protein
MLIFLSIFCEKYLGVFSVTNIETNGDRNYIKNGPEICLRDM